MMMSSQVRRLLAVLTVAFALIAVLVSLSGCIWIEGEPVEGEGGASAEDSDEGAGGQDPLGPLLPRGTGGSRAEVLAMGRSVMYDWFDHDGWDGRNELRRGDYWYFYGELETPPTIADSADAYIAQVPDETVIFFKLCFADFWASQDGDIQANVDENIAYVEQVVATANERNMDLIVGNALPKVKSETTPALVKTHIAYNEELERIASENANVWVFDQWGILANPQDGSLRKGLAVTPDDSHLSSVAYEELTPELTTVLDQVTAEQAHGD